VDNLTTRLSYQACTVDAQESDFADDDTEQIALRQVLALNATVGGNDKYTSETLVLKFCHIDSYRSALQILLWLLDKKEDYVQINDKNVQNQSAKPRYITVGLNTDHIWILLAAFCSCRRL
jgi:hypothetical protein